MKPFTKKLVIAAGLMLLAHGVVLADSISDIDVVNRKLQQSQANAPKKVGWHIGFSNDAASKPILDSSKNPQVCQAAEKAPCPPAAAAPASQASGANGNGNQ
jgi:hypothetical protein